MLTLSLLCHRRDLAPWVASSLQAEWPGWYGDGGEGNLAQDVHDFGASPHTLPVGLVALAGAEPVGFAALKQTSIPSHAHWSPWAAAGYVVPARRGQGIGASLLRGLVAQAASMGHPAVYCATQTATSLLERSGWVLQERVMHAGAPMGIYRSAGSPGR